MAYLVSQLRKNANTTYMTSLSFASTASISPNTFGGNTTFNDFALSGNFVPEQVYYLRFHVHRIPQYFYSGSKSKNQVGTYSADADDLNLQIILKNQNQDQEKNSPERIGSCLVSRSKYTEDSLYSSYSFVFQPSRTFEEIVFRIERVSFDAIYAGSDPRNWLVEQFLSPSSLNIGPVERQTAGDSVQVSTTGDRIVIDDLCTLNNIISGSGASQWLKFGYQSRPGGLIVVNGQPIRIGRSGTYQINNGTTIKSFMIASPGGTDNSKIDAFLLDYAYKTGGSQS